MVLKWPARKVCLLEVQKSVSAPACKLSREHSCGSWGGEYGYYERDFVNVELQAVVRIV